MPRPMRSGRARISLRHPQAMGECDRCGFWRNLDGLTRQFQWAGNNLTDTGMLVCQDTCLDVPQNQFRSPILPADPMPRINPRPSPNVTQVPTSIGQPLATSPENQGFTVYTLGITIAGTSSNVPIPPSGGSGDFTLDQSILDGPDVLAP